MEKIAYAIIGVAVGGAAMLVFYQEVHIPGMAASVQQAIVEATPVEPVIITEPRPEPATVLLVGDIMLDRGVEKSVIENGGGSYDFIFDYARDRVSDADLAFGNLEGPLSDEGRDLGGKYSFRFEPVAGEALARAGFDVVSLANNHIFDWGARALCDTPSELDRFEIASVGAGCDSERANKPHIATVGDTTVAFLAYTEFYGSGGIAGEDTPGTSDYTLEEITRTIGDLKESKRADLVFVSYHWGEEYQARSGAREQARAKVLIDSGADVIVGHHPHVVQEIELYGDGIIIYSLGNFVFDQHFSQETMRGQAVELSILEGDIVGWELIDVPINEAYQPILTLQ